MLISFSVSNYRSFGEEVTLNLVASNKLSDHRNHCVPIGETGKSVLQRGRQVELGPGHGVRSKFGD
jgi:AAA15 family ATPase/GTPase